MAATGFSLRRWLAGPFHRWAKKRRPHGRSIQLNQKRIFIFPGRTGWAFLAICILLLLIGINYENNLIHAIAFLMISLFVLSILHTYSNLSGITVTAVRSHSCFAGEQAEFELRLNAVGKRERENIQLAFEGCSTQTVDEVTQTPTTVRLYHPAPRRGLLKPGGLMLETYYPLGLLRAWSWLELDTDVVVYPAPVSSDTPLASSSVQGDGRLKGLDGGEDFSGLEQYQAGMPLRHIAWKNYARGQGLHSKTYAATHDERIWLEWESLAGVGTEARLSRICAWVLELEKTGEYYGLRMPGIEIEPDRGEQHRNKLLKRLALYRGGAVL